MKCESTNMQIQNEIYSEKWNEFLIHNGGSFLQSFEWGEFQRGLGRKIWRIKNDNFQASVIRHILPLGRSYLYCPRGPIITDNTQHTTNNFLSEIKKIAKTEKAIFLKIDPEWGTGSENILKRLGFKKSFKEVQPKKTLILDLTKSEEELLAEMHPKTRYNIRLAEKHGIKIQNSNLKSQNSKEDFEEFWKLLQETTKRDKFKPHPKEHYQKLLELIPGASLFLAEYQNKIIAANIVVFFGKQATYLHGASDFEFRNLMTPHLLQWRQILEAKKQGLTEYDFWGIDEKKWPGLTRFKKGFGGKELEYIGSWDSVFDKKQYAAYKLLTKFLKRV